MQRLLSSLAFSCLCNNACVPRVTSSSGAILVNKTIMVDLSFPYPATVAAIGMCGTSIISSLVVRLLQQGQKGNTKDGASGKSCMTPSLYLTTIVPTGLCMALAMQLGNTAYLYLPGEPVERACGEADQQQPLQHITKPGQPDSPHWMQPCMCAPVCSSKGCSCSSCLQL